MRPRSNAPVACTTVTPRLPSSRLGSVASRNTGGSTSSTMTLQHNTTYRFCTARAIHVQAQECRWCASVRRHSARQSTSSETRQQHTHTHAAAWHVARNSTARRTCPGTGSAGGQRRGYPARGRQQQTAGGKTRPTSALVCRDKGVGGAASTPRVVQERRCARSASQEPMTQRPMAAASLCHAMGARHTHTLPAHSHPHAPGRL
jgi:hypothetical protein